ncbi:MAG: ABC transporter ATP-binding protein [Candidatus Didemnitutus sp.]|nr:ABC transporter ATP-binding protein [Candidatus Didemnitutus sp.]
MKPLKPAPAADFLVLRRRDDEDENDEQFKPLEWGLIRRLLAYTGTQRAKRNWLLFLTVARAIQLSLLTRLMAFIIAGVIAKHELQRLPWAVGGYLALAVVTDMMFHFRQRFALELGEGVVNQLRADIFRRVMSMPLSFFTRVKAGRIIGRVTSDVEAVRVGIQDVLFVSMVQGGQMLFAAAFMAWTDWRLFLVVLGLAPVLWIVNRHFRSKLSTLSRAASESFSRVTATLAESVNGIRVTQGFARQETNAGLFRGLLADHARYNIALARTSAILTPLLELNSQFFISALLLLGGWRALHGTVDMDTIVTFFFFANQFFSPIQIIGNQYNQALVSMAGAERVFRLIDAKPDWEDAPEAVALPDPRSSGERAGLRVEFRDVVFGYDPARPVVHGLTFTAEPGQAVALVGHTGSGKSTIINLAAKFYLPTAGEVLLDGREIRTLTSHSLHQQMGLVQQQNFLFSGTVAENIRLGQPEATDAEVTDALRRLDCLDLIEALPGGIHAQVGEKGASLSLGQRQLVCFARALLADPRLLIFDEATSAIDTLTEARLQKALVTLLRGRTSFIVAHRLSTIRQADLILVLDRGRIVERGTHAELLQRGGVYANLHAQFVQTDDAG